MRDCDGLVFMCFNIYVYLTFEKHNSNYSVTSLSTMHKIMCTAFMVQNFFFWQQK